MYCSRNGSSGSLYCASRLRSPAKDQERLEHIAGFFEVDPREVHRLHAAA